MDCADAEENDLGESAVCVRRRTNAGPWFNKKEFDDVHNWIYGPSANLESKEKAVKQIKVWKLRRLNLTSGAILSTLLVLEAELKDARYTEDDRTQDARALYSSAFTRFLNYMSAISQTQNMKTMYAAARELNIDPFLVDLRHICAHSHTLPTIDVFRRASRYCLDWLREFYWDMLKESMLDVDAKSVRRKDITKFDVNLREQFQTYDAATEALARGCNRVAEAKKHLAKDKFVMLKGFAASKDEEMLEKLVEACLASMHQSIRHGCRLKDISQVFVDAFFEMTYFFEAGSGTNDKQLLRTLTRRYQSLFQTIASNALIEDLYHALVETAENELETIVRRKGAGFWAKQLVASLSALKRVKTLQRRQREQNANRALSLSSINMKLVPRDVINAYNSLGLSVKSTLIFGDSLKCPWTLSFSRQYIVERMEQINEYSVDLVRSCFDLVEPPLSLSQRTDLEQLIEIRMGHRLSDTSMDSDRIFTLKKDVLNNAINDDVDMDGPEDEDANQEKIGIWTRVSYGQEWSSCPLGRLMWE